ncbi:hypothetical protein F0U60_06255 [Archangium minus]|uniref:Uncharacterized protein n=1 Tax=Archangium minus TaxID=83450 RepID=A0ABY9WIV9_9BACT|nr:hypothetical protein F0U60_06255 [Archangium minus]
MTHGIGKPLSSCANNCGSTTSPSATGLTSAARSSQETWTLGHVLQQYRTKKPLTEDSPSTGPPSLYARAPRSPPPLLLLGGALLGVGLLVRKPATEPLAVDVAHDAQRLKARLNAASLRPSVLRGWGRVGAAGETAAVFKVLRGAS